MFPQTKGEMTVFVTRYAVYCEFITSVKRCYMLHKNQVTIYLVFFDIIDDSYSQYFKNSLIVNVNVYFDLKG